MRTFQKRRIKDKEEDSFSQGSWATTAELQDIEEEGPNASDMINGEAWKSEGDDLALDRCPRQEGQTL